MKTLHKLGLLGLVLALSLSLLAGCSNTTSQSGTAGTPDQSAPQVSDAANTPEDSAEPQDSTAPAGDFTTVEAGKLIMSTNAAFPPYEMVKDDGTFEGIDVEIAGKIAEKLGLELEILDMDFTAAVNAPAQGKADMCMAGLTVNEERQKNLDFTDTYANGVQVVIVPENSDITSIDDLEGKLIGTQEGTTGYNYCSASPEDGGYGEENVIAYTNGATAVQALLSGKVDCVVIDSMPAEEYVKANPGLKILETEFTNEDYAIAVKKGNTALLNAINTALNELIEDGTVQSIVDSYIKAD